MTGLLPIFKTCHPWVCCVPGSGCVSFHEFKDTTREFQALSCGSQYGMRLGSLNEENFLRWPKEKEPSLILW